MAKFTKADFNAEFKWADADYFKTYDIRFIAGMPYPQADSVNGFVVNDLMTKKLGFKHPEDILGKRIAIWGGTIVAPVVGVVRDFNGSSLEKEMRPVVLGSVKQVYRVINIKIQPQQVKQTLAAIEKLWNNTFPDFTYEYRFLDDKIANLYRQESRLSQLYQLFAGIVYLLSKEFTAYWRCIFNRNPICLVFHASMAAKVCIQNKHGRWNIWINSSYC
jgi:putative ABC transport system permease protein